MISRWSGDDARARGGLELAILAGLERAAHDCWNRGRLGDAGLDVGRGRTGRGTAKGVPIDDGGVQW